MHTQPCINKSLEMNEPVSESACYTPCLFVLYDSGEAEFLAPVIDRLESEKKDYRILVMGIAKDIIAKKNFPASKVLTLESLGVHQCVDTSWPKVKGLTEADIEWVHSQLKTSQIVVGPASAIQRQFLKEYDLEAKTFAVWTNFDPSVAGEGQKVAQRVLNSAQKVLYPSGYVQENMQDGPENFAVVGHPSLVTFCQEYAQINPLEVRKKLNLREDQKVVAYLGGYSGDSDYRQGFELFAQCLAKKTFEDTLFIVQPHPKSGEGTFEREMMAKYGVMNYWVPPIKTITSQEIVAISSGPVLCHKSSVGIKVAALGKEIIHLLPEEDNWTNALIDSRASPKISTPDAFNQALLSSKGSKNFFDIYAIMKMPREAVDLVYNEIEYREGPSCFLAQAIA